MRFVIFVASVHSPNSSIPISVLFQLMYIWLLLNPNLDAFPTDLAFCARVHKSVCIYCWRLSFFSFIQFIVHYPMGMGNWAWINLGRVENG